MLPAGTRDVGYSTLLHSIDWNVLYTRFHGYELFEDLKQQWAQQGFDYVLIDSRTGYTDVGGICTRHLPDAVVLMFFPNDQNLLGLETIAKEIRGEASGQDARNIVLHFCASNVPDLDDEDYILERKMKDATQLLKLKGSPVIIHHYNSLALLEQSIFVQDRPKSKLATEYRELVKTIISDNLKDREGALLKLKSLLQREAIIGRDANDQEITSTLARVREFHPNDGEVNLAVAEMYYRLGDFEDELEVLGGCYLSRL